MKLLAIIPFAFASATALAQFPAQIKNIIVIVQENRTPDNLFHYLTPACPLPANASGLEACTLAPVTAGCYNIASCGVSNQSGKPVAVKLKPVPLAGSGLPQHSHWSFEKMCDTDPATMARGKLRVPRLVLTLTSRTLPSPTTTVRRGICLIRI